MLPALLEVPRTPSSGWISLLQSLTELEETFTYVYRFIIKDTIKDREEQARVRSERVQSTGVSVPMELECATLPVPRSSFNPEAAQSLSFKSFF